MLPLLDHSMILLRELKVLSDKWLRQDLTIILQPTVIEQTSQQSFWKSFPVRNSWSKGKSK